MPRCCFCKRSQETDFEEKDYVTVINGINIKLPHFQDECPNCAADAFSDELFLCTGKLKAIETAGQKFEINWAKVAEIIIAHRYHKEIASCLKILEFLSPIPGNCWLVFRDDDFHCCNPRLDTDILYFVNLEDAILYAQAYITNGKYKVLKVESAYTPRDRIQIPV